MPAQEPNAVVVQKIEVAPGLMILRVAPDGWPLPDFSPGQFVTLGLPGAAPRCAVCEPEEQPAPADKMIVRAYSIASSSVALEYLEFFITLVRSGALTPRLFALKVGDRFWLSPKVTGLFTMDDVPADMNLLLIATGTGLAPYMSMLRTHLTAGEPRRFAVIHGARHSWDLAYRSELVTLQRICRNFAYVPVVSRPQDEPTAWAGAMGYVQDVWTRRTLDEAWKLRPAPENTHVFLCGNPGMVEKMQDILTAEGFKKHLRKEPGQIHVEKYW